MAANNVIRHYDLAASQKMIDWGAAITTVMAVYLPRVAVTVEATQKAGMKPTQTGIAKPQVA